MAYKIYNPNPARNKTGDCAVRAISRLFNTDWESAYMMLAIEGLKDYDMMNEPHVIGALLTSRGYKQRNIEHICPDCTTVENFANEHKMGNYAVITNGHIIAVVDGDYYDSWNSGDEVVLYYYEEAM